MSFSTDVLSWTSENPLESQLFSPWGVLYRFQTEESLRGQKVTTLWRAGRGDKEDRVAKLEWDLNGGLGRAIIGKLAIPMTDLVRPDPRNMAYRSFSGPDGHLYRWRPSGNSHDVILQDSYGTAIALVRPIRPKRYPNGDVFAELHFLPGPGSVLHPPLMDMITVTAMLYRFCMAYGL